MGPRSPRPVNRFGIVPRRASPEALIEASAIGLERVLITCDEDNIASARTIERNGGAYEDSRGGKRRYWVPTRR